jgi:hypothetical protein
MTGNGGLLQLVATGKQDIYLTGNPQISWFKMVYRRYTNFAIESQAMFFDGDPDFGKRLSCLVPRRGDLLGPIVLEITLPALTLSDGNATPVSYVNSIGHALIDEITLEIGEQEIDTQTGEWMELWSNMTTTTMQRQGFNDMIGKVDDYIQPQNFGPLKLYIPLRFWFCKNPGQYLPLLALQYHPIRINLKLNPLQNLFITPSLGNSAVCSTLAVNPIKITDMRMFGDYVYLDVEERRRFVSNTHEYLIEQIQYTPQISIPIGATSSAVRLEFNHPIRELLWFIQRNQMITNHEYFNYSSTSILESGARRDMLQDAIVQLDGYDRFDRRDAGYFRLVQPYYHHTVVPNNLFIYNYCFALRPEELQPSGSLNASRIDSFVLQMNIVPDATDTSVPPRGNAYTRVYATNHNVLRVVNGFGGILFTI